MRTLPLAAALILVVRRMDRKRAGRPRQGRERQGPVAGWLRAELRHPRPLRLRAPGLQAGVRRRKLQV